MTENRCCQDRVKFTHMVNNCHRIKLVLFDSVAFHVIIKFISISLLRTQVLYLSMQYFAYCVAICPDMIFIYLPLTTMLSTVILLSPAESKYHGSATFIPLWEQIIHHGGGLQPKSHLNRRALRIAVSCVIRADSCYRQRLQITTTGISCHTVKPDQHADQAKPNINNVCMFYPIYVLL